MGYSNGKKWTKELIHQGIKDVMKALDIERMPSNSECVRVTNSNALSVQISRNGGFYGIADELGLKKKSCGTEKSLVIENRLNKMFIDQGHKSKVTSFKCPYDILIDDCLKVEVKHSLGYSNAYYTCNLYEGDLKSDILIFVCENEVLGDKTYIIPTHLLHGLKQLSIGKKSKYNKFINSWSYLDQFLAFYKTIV